MLAIAIDIQGLIYTCLFCVYFVVCYFVVIASRLDKLFKQGSTWQIRTAQIIISFLLSFLLAQGTMQLINSMQF